MENENGKPELKNEKPLKTKAAKRPKLTRKEKDEIMASMGLTKVRGAVSGRIYYE